jgi:hypothetical protein
MSDILQRELETKMRAYVQPNWRSRIRMRGTSQRRVRAIPERLGKLDPTGANVTLREVAGRLPERQEGEIVLLQKAHRRGIARVFVRAFIQWRARHHGEGFMQYKTPLTPEQEAERDAWRAIKEAAARELWKRSIEREQLNHAGD